MAALEVAAEHDVGVNMENAAVVDMRERPVVIALVDEILERAWRVVGVAVNRRPDGGV
jgi:hypothetical protein